MKNIILVLSILLSTLTYGQQNISQGGLLKGSIFESESNSPVEYASVSLISTTDNSTINGTLSDIGGNFSISNIPYGEYFLKVDFIGYQSFTTDIFNISEDEKFKNFDKISISTDADVLEEVTVTAERTYIENKIDKKVVNIGKDLLNAGSSAIEIMQNIPSVDVDIEGTVSLRGSSNVRILVDGRPTNLESEDLLSSIPAENIDKIEVITNPSAKYDPEGISGILNIVLKKNKKLGFNGTASVGVGSQNEFSGVNKYNSSINLNYNIGKWNFFTNYGYRDDIRESGGDFERKLFASDGSSNGVITQESDSERGRLSHRIKAGFDYYISDKTFISYSSNMNFSERNSSNLNTYQNPYQKRETTSENDGSGINHEIVLRHDFSEISKLEVSVFRDDDSDLTNGLFLSEDITGQNPTERDLNDSYDNLTSAQTDYVFENDKFKFEAGFKWQNRFMDSDYTYFQNDISNIESIDTARSNRFQFEESLYSTYFNYGQSFGKWAAQIGMRYEIAQTSSTLVGDAKSPYDNNYNNFFPSIFITRKITETDELGLSYSKRVSRPRSRQLNPARYYSDTLNIRTGNPYLNPEFTNSLEFAYNKYWKGGSFSSAIFYRNSTDVIQRVNIVDNNGVATRTYDNIASTNDFGFEASAMAKIYKWWSLNANINLYMTNLNSDDPNFSNDGFNWFFRMNNTFNLSKSVSIQASGRYMGKRVIPQGNIDPMYGMDLGLRYTFMDKKATLSLRVSDVFNTFRFNYNTLGSGFQEVGHRKWESRVAYITFAYNFGQKSKKKKDRIKKEEGNDMQGGGEMEGI